MQSKEDKIHNIAQLIQSLKPSDSQKFTTWDIITAEFKEDFKSEILDYWHKRNLYNAKIKSTVYTELKHLQNLFASNPNIYDIRIMSSYTANTNLNGTSDIDIGCIVHNMDEQKVSDITQTLTDNNYKFTKLMNGYYCYTKFINHEDELIEIEVKVRDLDESKTIMALHEYLDTKCDITQKMIYTYLKYRLYCVKDTYPKAYSFIKMLFYNINLLKLNPTTTWFISNI
jgi:hypothetical protein